LLTLLSWTALYFLTLGFSEVRFMRYTLPLMPTLCVFAAAGVLSLAGWLQQGRDNQNKARLFVLALSSFLCLIALVGTYNVVFPFVAPDPRDQAARFIKAQSSTPASVGLSTRPWFWTPPLSPLDAPPGSPYHQMPLPQLEEELEKLVRFTGKPYRFIITEFKAERLEQAKPQWFVLSEFEWRDKQRLHEAGFQNFMERLQENYTLTAEFKNRAPLTLPGRDFVPHDYLYTNPEVRIFRLRP
jgi:hypothetical protein